MGRFVGFVVVLVGLGLSANSYSATVLNEDFEVPVINSGFITVYSGQTLASRSTWNITSGSVDLTNMASYGITAYDGQQAVDLNGSPGPGTMGTYIDTVIGQSYSLTFHYARNGGANTQVAAMQVDVIGSSNLFSQYFEHSGDGGLGLAPNDFLAYSTAFTADSTSTYLKFTGLLPAGGASYYGIMLDGINVSSVPIPAAVWLFGSGLFGLFGLAKRKA